MMGALAWALGALGIVGAAAASSGAGQPLSAEALGLLWAGVGAAATYGVAMALGAPKDRRLLGLRPLVAAGIEARLGGYRQRVNPEDPEGPVRPRRVDGDAPPSVCVVGGGIAGLSAATVLSERGFRVVLREAKDHLGGKIGAWRETLGGPRGAADLPVEHGFHAFFRHYYNLNALMERLGLRETFEAIPEYVILEQGGGTLTFEDGETTPGLNMLEMHRQGMFRWRELLTGPAKDEMGVLLEYDPEQTFDLLDGDSFEAFAERTRLPRKLRLAFNTFSRAFFAEQDRMSLAELVKSFHFYYLSHDHGLLYDYPASGYSDGVLAPWQRHLEAHGASLQTSAPVRRLERAADGARWDVDGHAFDHVVVATDVVGTRRVLTASETARVEAPALYDALTNLGSSQRYSVVRLWLDRDVREDVPVFVITDRVRCLDAIAFVHRTDPEMDRWAWQHGRDSARGAVVELHSYAVPDALPDDRAIRDAMVADFEGFFPEARGATVLHEHLQVNANFAAFHVGHHAARPTTEGVPGAGDDGQLDGLVFAGDWVKLPRPAMLMEAACTSGLLAANAVLDAHGLRQEPIDSVPPKGLLAGTWPARQRARQRVGAAAG